MPLSGGRITPGVVKVGNTVRRPAAASSPFVAELLRHLHRQGFTGAPRHLGFDAAGREILSYLPGWVPARFQHWTDPQVAAVGSLLRALHDATRGSHLAGRRPVVCHHDPGPNNTVFSEGVPVAFIDFDTAARATPLEDRGYVAWTWCISYRHRSAAGHHPGRAGTRPHGCLRARLHVSLRPCRRRTRPSGPQRPVVAEQPDAPTPPSRRRPPDHGARPLVRAGAHLHRSAPQGLRGSPPWLPSAEVQRLNRHPSGSSEAFIVQVGHDIAAFVGMTGQAGHCPCGPGVHPLAEVGGQAQRLPRCARGKYPPCEREPNAASGGHRSACPIGHVLAGKIGTGVGHELSLAAALAPVAAISRGITGTKGFESRWLTAPLANGWSGFSGITPPLRLAPEPGDGRTRYGSAEVQRCRGRNHPGRSRRHVRLQWRACRRWPRRRLPRGTACTGRPRGPDRSAGSAHRSRPRSRAADPPAPAAVPQRPGPVCAWGTRPGLSHRFLRTGR
ncbi:phosphotransferase family protein [Streptomyces massasporeus]